jgi:aminoglycoside phosphotransferase family enzyme/predicted kinase
VHTLCQRHRGCNAQREDDAVDEARADSLALAQALARPEAYPGDATASSGVHWLQTHISHVFLTRERVYKLRKAVRPGFLDFGELALRNADCLKEVALNRRLAPDVYLGVAPVLPAASGAVVGELSEDLRNGLEHVVVMRRLPEGSDALSLLARGALTPAHVDAVAERIAAFHAGHGLGCPAPFTPEDWRARIAEPARANLATLREASAGDARARAAVEELGRATERELGAGEQRFEERRRAGRAVDGHGDLHLQHVWFEGGPPVPVMIDCIEFSDRLRQIDAASEVAFFAMDLRYRGAAPLAERFLRKYAALRDDFGLYGVVDFFVSYRAAVRAKVAALAGRDSGIAPAQREEAAASAARHRALALASLAPARAQGLALVCGSVGTGKSSVAQALADACGGVVISSDRTRKALAGLPATARAAARHEQGLYAPAVTERVYAELLARALPVAGSGRLAILDATFARRAQRDAARALAAEHDWPCALVEVTCDEAVVRERLRERAARGDDPSDAGPELVGPSRAGFEPIVEWPERSRARLSTNEGGWHSGIAALCAGLGLNPHAEPALP